MQDVFKMAAEFRHMHLNAIETTKAIQVCKPENLPEKEKPSKMPGYEPKHIDTGLCVMFHKDGGTVLEVRGYDEDGKEFSYKFHYGNTQPCTMRYVEADGTVCKLHVEKQDSAQN